MEKSDELIRKGTNWSIRTEKGEMILHGNGYVNCLKLMVDGRDILRYTSPLEANYVEGKTTIRINPWDLSPLQGEWIYLRGNAGHYLDVERLDAKEGSLDLVLKSEDRRTYHYPILPYAISKMKTMEFDPPNIASLIPYPEKLYQ